MKLQTFKDDHGFQLEEDETHIDEEQEIENNCEGDYGELTEEMVEQEILEMQQILTTLEQNMANILVRVDLLEGKSGVATKEPIEVKHESFPLTCDQWDYEENQKGVMKTHIELHEKFLIGQFDCKAKHQRSLTKHIKANNVNAPCWCNEFDYKDKCKEYFKTCIESIHFNTKYAYDQCICKTKFKLDFNAHIDSVHLNCIYILL